jgi:hypothetical protein
MPVKHQAHRVKEEEGSTIVNFSAAHYGEHTTQISFMNTEKIL